MRLSSLLCVAVLGFSSLFAKADITLTLQSSSCTQGVNSATLNGLWKNGSCVKSDNITIPNSTCINGAVPAALIRRWETQTQCCSVRYTLDTTRTVDDQCNLSTSSDFNIGDIKCVPKTSTGFEDFDERGGHGHHPLIDDKTLR